jgi:hypothetical protein
VNGEIGEYEEGAVITTKEQEEKGQTGKIVVKRILEDSIDFVYEKKDSQEIVNIKEGKALPIILKKDESVTIGVNKINLKKEASITIMPLVARAETQANFTFRIGIEKRAIKLSPEKTKELIEDLDNSIVKWEQTVNRLGNLVKTWKGTCFAGSALLIASNFLANLGGRGEARKAVMRIWENKCAEEVGLNKKYATMHACYKDHPEIETDIDKWLTLRKNANKEIEELKKIKGVVTPAEGLAKPVLNEERFIEEAKRRMQQGPSVELRDKNGKNPIKSEEIVSRMDELQRNGYLFSEDVKDLMNDVNIVDTCNKPNRGGFSEVFCNEHKQEVYSKFLAYNKVLEGLPDLDKEEWQKNNPGFWFCIPIENR